MTGMIAGATGGPLAQDVGRAGAQPGMASTRKARAADAASQRTAASHGAPQSAGERDDEHAFAQLLGDRPSKSRKVGAVAAGDRSPAAGGTDAQSNRALPYDALMRAQLRADAASGTPPSPPAAQAGAEAHPPATGGRPAIDAGLAAGAWSSLSDAHAGVTDDTRPRPAAGKPSHAGADAPRGMTAASQRRHAATIARETDCDGPGAAVQRATPAKEDTDVSPHQDDARGGTRADAAIPATAVAPTASGDPALAHPVGSAAATGRPNGTSAMAPPPVSQQIANAILASARQAPDEGAATGINRAFVLVLQPEQAGDVHIRLRLTRDKLSVTIAAAAREAHAVLHRDREVLGHLLADLAPEAAPPEITIVQAMPAAPQPDVAGGQSGATGQDEAARHAPPARALPPASDHEVERHDEVAVPVGRRSRGIYL